MRNRKAEGSVSIFLALTITMLLSFCMILVESARENAMLLKASMVFDTGMQSIMAEYHQKLWEAYDLLYIDSSYGESLPDYGLVKARLGAHIDKNLLYDAVGYFALKYEECRMTEVELATDFSGADFYSQAVRAAETSLGFAYIERALGWLEQVETSRYVREYIASDSNQTDTAIEENNGTVVEVEEAVWGKDAKGQPVLIREAEYETVDISNPLDRILSGNILLRQIVGDISEVSINQIEEASLASNRSLAAGSYDRVRSMEELEQAADASTSGLWQKALFCKYALDHFESYVDCESEGISGEEVLTRATEGDDSERASLKYPLEYLIGGKTTDAMNLEIVAAELLAIREVDNYLLILQDQVKRAEADALGAAAATLVPWIAPLVSQGFLIYWAYEESVEDLQRLFQGGEVPLVKALNIESDFEVLLSYEDYLFILLLMQGRERLTMRALDMIESDIRGEQESFRIDACISRAVFTGSFRDIYDKRYTIEDRIHYYEEAA